MYKRLLSKPLWRELHYAMYKHCLGESASEGMDFVGLVRQDS